MPFLKFSRDKRGYENLYLVEPSNRRGRSRSQILYWFRSPPNVKVGREAFDPAVRLALEAQHPNLRFDWPRLLDIHIPPVEVEEWRERRRAARAAKQAADEEAAAERREQAPAEDVAIPVETSAAPAAEDTPASDSEDVGSRDEGPESREVRPGGPVGGQQATPDPNRRRRRRRRGRRRPEVAAAVESGTPEPGAVERGTSDVDEAL